MRNFTNASRWHQKEAARSPSFRSRPRRLLHRRRECLLLWSRVPIDSTLTVRAQRKTTTIQGLRVLFAGSSCESVRWFARASPPKLEIEWKSSVPCRRPPSQSQAHPTPGLAIPHSAAPRLQAQRGNMVGVRGGHMLGEREFAATASRLDVAKPSPAYQRLHRPGPAGTWPLASPPPQSAPSVDPRGCPAVRALAVLGFWKWTAVSHLRSKRTEEKRWTGDNHQQDERRS